VTPLPPTLRFGRQVGAGNFLLFPLSERNVVPLLLKERGKGVRCKEAAAFPVPKRNDRVILPADRSVAKVGVDAITDDQGKRKKILRRIEG